MDSKSRFFIKLAYRGDNYHGWQVQDNAVSVQQTIETVLSTITGKPVEIIGCGRTDTGVHALEYFAHADLPADIEPIKLLYKMNRMLPDDIGIMDVLPVVPEAHARFDAVRRTYEYRVLRHKDPFRIGLSYYYHGELDLDAMNECASLLPEFSDFSAFSKSNTQVNNNLCNVYFAGWIEHGEELIFTISANRFLRNMVRAVVGTLMEAGRGKLSKTQFISIIEKGNRSEAGTSVPASGLFLKSIEYPANIFLR